MWSHFLRLQELPVDLAGWRSHPVQPARLLETEPPSSPPWTHQTYNINITRPHRVVEKKRSDTRMSLHFIPNGFTVLCRTVLQIKQFFLEETDEFGANSSAVCFSQGMMKPFTSLLSHFSKLNTLSQLQRI